MSKMLKEERDAEERRRRRALRSRMRVTKDPPLSQDEREGIGRSNFEYQKKMGWIPTDAVYHRGD